MPLKIIRQDLTKIKCDAIVNPTDPHYTHGGGTDAAVHAAAGVELYHACVAEGWLSVGKAVVTPAYALPCKHVIHTVGPRWNGGACGEEALLRSCYRESLRLAKEHKCRTLAIPLISAGTFGFPKDRVLKIAVDEIGSFLLENEMLVYVVVFDKTAYAISEKLFLGVTSFIEDTYEAERSFCKSARIESCDGAPFPMGSLDDMLEQIDESFSQMLLRKIDERGMTDVACYKKANIDRKLFSKIRSDVSYKPSKPTVLAFAIALELSFAETEDMLRKAGFALSHSNKFDIIIEYFIRHGKYDIHEINEVLYQFDHSSLGG